jgi:peroxiredoxin
MRNKIIFAVLLGLTLWMPYLAKADDEALALEKFNRAVQAADPARVRAEFERSNTNMPTKEEMNKLVTGMVDATMDVMDQAGQFEKQFPQSKQLVGIQGSMIDTLERDFGSMGFPIPKDRASDVESCVRNLIGKTPNERQLYMVLVRVASASPIAKAHDMLVELGGDSTPEPARQMAQKALVNLERIGSPVDFNFTALDGRRVKLADLRGKVVLVDFWATTCVPCVREMPDLKQLYEKHHTIGLEIVGISLDSDKTALTRFIEKEKIPWPQFYDPAGATNRFAVQYGVSGIPVMWLLDKHGVLRQLDARDNQEAKVEALLKE